MHDAKGKELKLGDRVLVPAVITELSPTEEYCNVTLETARGRRPDGQKERISAINTAVVYRAGPEDSLTVDEMYAAEADKEPTTEQSEQVQA